jgi:hypothetical protein
MNKDELKDKITELFKNLFPTATDEEANLVPQSLTDGKLYEAYILTVVVEQLVTRENLSLKLVNGNHIQLKSSPGPINRNYPWIEVYRRGVVVAELWTDIEYLSMSFANSGRAVPNKGDYHELDIVLTDPWIKGRPTHDSVWLGVECKNTAYSKSLLKEILGIRRELSLLTDDQPTKFRQWPRTKVPAKPASCLLVFSSQPSVLDYSDPGVFFGIDFFHEQLPAA